MLLTRCVTLGACVMVGVVSLTGCGSSAPSNSAPTAAPAHSTAATSVATPAQRDPAAQRRWRQVSDPIGDVEPRSAGRLGIDIASLGVAASAGRSLRVRVGTATPVTSGTIEIRLPTAAGIARAHIALGAGTGSAELAIGRRSVPGSLARRGTWTIATFAVHLRLTARPSALASQGRSQDEVPGSLPVPVRHAGTGSLAHESPPRTPASAAW